MQENNSIIFGPIPSRRFGMSLGIDLSPSSKQCNYDCLYCELDKAKTLSSQNHILSVEEIINELKKSLQKYPQCDVITLTANGEPTLYPHLDKLIEAIECIKKDAKTLILSNGSTIYKHDIQNTLAKLDIVKLSLDCISQNCYKKLDRVDSSVEVELIPKGMIKFSKLYNKSFIIEILFVKNINDNTQEIQKLYKTLCQINPHRVDIGTIDRPPAYDVEAVSFEKLQEIADQFERLPVNITYKKRPKRLFSYTQEEILNLLRRRPLTQDDIENTFDSDSQKKLGTLLAHNIVQEIQRSGVIFYKTTNIS